MKVPFLVHAQTSESSGNVGLIGMLKIAFASWGRNVLLTRAVSHSPSSLSISCSTLSKPCIWHLGLTTLKVLGVGIHLSLHIFTFFPFPIIHREPLSIVSLAANRLLHTYEGLWPICFHKCASSKILCLKDFVSNGAWILLNAPPLFGQKCEIESLKVFEPHATFWLRFA